MLLGSKKEKSEEHEESHTSAGNLHQDLANDLTKVPHQSHNIQQQQQQSIQKLPKKRPFLEISTSIVNPINQNIQSQSINQPYYPSSSNLRQNTRQHLNIPINSQEEQNREKPYVWNIYSNFSDKKKPNEYITDPMLNYKTKNIDSISNSRFIESQPSSVIDLKYSNLTNLPSTSQDTGFVIERNVLPSSVRLANTGAWISNLQIPESSARNNDQYNQFENSAISNSEEETLNVKIPFTRKETIIQRPSITSPLNTESLTRNPSVHNFSVDEHDDILERYPIIKRPKTNVSSGASKRVIQYPSLYPQYANNPSMHQAQDLSLRQLTPQLDSQHQDVPFRRPLSMPSTSRDEMPRNYRPVNTLSIGNEGNTNEALAATSAAMPINLRNAILKAFLATRLETLSSGILMGNTPSKSIQQADVSSTINERGESSAQQVQSRGSFIKNTPTSAQLAQLTKNLHYHQSRNALSADIQRRSIQRPMNLPFMDISNNSSQTLYGDGISDMTASSSQSSRESDNLGQRAAPQFSYNYQQQQHNKWPYSVNLHQSPVQQVMERYQSGENRLPAASTRAFPVGRNVP